MSDTFDLHREFFELKGKFEVLSESVSKLTQQVENLTATLNQSKGAYMVVLTVPAIVGGLFGVLTYFGIKISAGN